MPTGGGNPPMKNPSQPSSTSEYVSRMFGAIADHYDLMNWVMTFGQDQRWRRQAADVATLVPGGSALDVATGTGDLAFELARRVGENGTVVGVDFSQPMLEIAQRKAAIRGIRVGFEGADALHLPYDPNTFDAVTCAFGVRNMEERPAALSEMARVTRSGGRVVVLELTPPSNTLARKYMDDVIPRLGALIARAREAYTYLPASVQQFPGPAEFGRMMQESGLRGVTYRLLNFGTVALHWGTKK
jgi:demethylmenaquinone methyltransferase/2-methoxy-6-polyprenyl-1,4-benzoquinol methylase